MDPFTARMLERARDRQRRVDERTGTNVPAVTSSRSPLRAGASINSDMDGPRQTDKLSASPRRPLAPGDQPEDKENHPNALHASTRSRLKQLGSLYSGDSGTDLDAYDVEITPRRSAVVSDSVEPEPAARPALTSTSSSSAGLRGRLAGLASQYNQLETEVPAPAPAPSRQSRPATREPAGRPSERSRSPVKAAPTSRWEVRSPSPLRRQIRAGERPPPDDGCRVSAGAPALVRQYRPTGPERTTVTTEVKVSVGGERHRTSMHRSPSGSPLRAAADPGPPEQADQPVTHVSRAQYRPAAAAARQPLPQHPDPPAAGDGALNLDDETVRSLEAQGFTPSGSRTRLVYQFDEPTGSPPPPRVVSAVAKPSPERTTAAPYRSASPVRYSPPPRPQPSSPTGVPFNAPAREWSPTRQPSPVRQGSPTRQPSPVRGRLVQERAAMFDRPASPPPPDVEPTEMTLSDRRKLFEKGQAPKVIARFGTPVTPHMLRQHAAESARDRPVLEQSRSRSPVRQTGPQHQPQQPQQQQHHYQPQQPQQQQLDGPPSPSRGAVGESTFQAHRKLWESMNSDWRQNSIAQSSLQQRQKELGYLANRWQHKPAELEKAAAAATPAAPLAERTPAVPSPEKIPPPPPPPPPPAPSAGGVSPTRPSGAAGRSPARYAEPEPHRSPPTRPFQVRVKPGCLYPSLSDLETASSSQESEPEPESGRSHSREGSPASAAYRTADESTVSYASGHSDAESLGAEILAMARANQPPASLPTIDESSADSSSDLSGLAACAAIDDVLDDMDQDQEPTPPKRTRTARQDSGVFRTPMASVKSPEQDPSLPSVVLDGDGAEVPLLHSVSFYRRQRPQEVPVTPVRPAVRSRQTSHQTDDQSSSGGQQRRRPSAGSSQERVKQLQSEAMQQLTVMSQASRALNLCNSTIEFTGSAEMVEAERLLLVATHRRQAALSEIQRLKTEGAMREQGIVHSASRGSLSVSSVTLPVKSSFVREVAAGSANYVYYFVVLLRYRGQVIATQMLSSEDSIKGNAINFPNLVSFRDLEAEFCVALEVYGLQAPRELLPHDAKYHIRKDRTKTPKKLLKQQSSLTSPAVQSPAGPGAVRATSFQLMGFIHLTARNLTNNSWALEKVPAQTPLDGGVLMTVTCHADCAVEERGFITVFDDVSGFGAWHRRWAVLSGGRLSFWKYPEDESRQPAMAEVDLRRCVTERVGPVPRDICARQNTLLLVTVREARPADADSLVMQRRGAMTRIRHLLSLDVRDERHLWADKLNETLANIRAWDPDAMQPDLDPSA